MTTTRWPRLPGSIAAAAIAAVALCACGSSGPYPDHAADAALCKTYNADLANYDTPGIQAAVQQAAGSVTGKLAKDINAVVNAGGTEQQDALTLVHVAEDCALVSVGKAPGT
ncbi:MAG: hypothetical protein ACRDOU_33215 [Streptosporangiaceae bacterium]